MGISTINLERLAEQRPELLQLVERLRHAPLPVVLLALAIAPAIGEEFFFRGYLLGALRGRLPAWAAICVTAMIFGLFHASVGGVIAVERIVSSTFLGLVLGWVCWTTRSVLPGMALHFLNNALMVSLAYFGEQLKGLGWDVEGARYLPLPLVAGGSVVAVVALASVWWQSRASSEADVSDAATVPGAENALPPG